MLTEAELTHWFQRLAIPEQGRAMIHHVRSSDPARRVGGGHRNVSGRYPSRKMGVTIQFESHRVELAEIYEMEHDADEVSKMPRLAKSNRVSSGRSKDGVAFSARPAVVGAPGWLPPT
jgi:hypothetical protein